MVELLKNVATIHNWRRNYTPSDNIHIYSGVYIRYSLDVDNFLKYLSDDSQKHHTALELIVMDYDLSDIVVDHEYDETEDYTMGEDVWDVANDKFYRAVQDVTYTPPVQESSLGAGDGVDAIIRELTDTTYWTELTPAFRGNDIIQRIVDRVGNSYKIMLRVTPDQYNSNYINQGVGLLVEVSNQTEAFLYSTRNHVIGDVGNSFTRSNSENSCKLFVESPPSSANDRAGYLLHNFNTR